MTSRPWRKIKPPTTNDRMTAERDHKLLPVGSVSQQTVDDADATALSAAAKVKADEAAVQGARINLGYTKVRAPIEGIARQQQVTQGALVGSSTNDSGSGGTLLTTVDEIDSLYANFTMSAADLMGLHQAQTQGEVALAQQNKITVQIVLTDGGLYNQPGILDFSDSAVNATTGAVNLRALVPNAQHELMSGNVRDAETLISDGRTTYFWFHSRLCSATPWGPLR